LVAPLVVDGRVTGALVVAARSETLFDETDEMALQVLVLLAAGALAAAERLDTTRALTLRDPLTGLANRRKLDQDLEAVASADGAAFLMVDIDHFKAFNDRHGHRKGDDLLRIVAGAITTAVRDGDIVYRYGGEEFSVLLVGADVVEAGVVAERLRASVRAATVRGDIGPITVSVGVAAHGAPIAASSLVEHADAALYAAKEAGRDRVLVRRTRGAVPAGEG
jgi:diguanylate cyclase (GGDEF)-like protein